MYRHGELLIIPQEKVEGRRLPYLVLAEGEATGHMHKIVDGDAILYQADQYLTLAVLSKYALLAHPDHKTLTIPKGIYRINVQREYQPSEEQYQKVVD